MKDSTVLLTPGRLCGTVDAPPSKSAAHRGLLCAALAALTSPQEGPSTLAPLALSADIAATLGAVRALGVREEWRGDACTLRPGEPPRGRVEIDCGESGSTLRFLIPIAAALGAPAVFTGRGRLPQRPIGLYGELLPQHGVACGGPGGLPFSVSGRLAPGEFALPGNVSSQFVTGLLLALPLLEGDSQIVLTTPLESAAYVEMTVQAMAAFGVAVHPVKDGWLVPGGQRYRPCRWQVEGDWSQAAFFLAAGALGGDVAVRGLRPDSLQGDKAAAGLLAQGGALLSWEEGALRCRAGAWRGVAIDASQIPDLVPILAAAFALAEGETVICRAERLRLKESDRLAAMAQGLNALGARVRETADGLAIAGVPALRGGLAEGANDHRVVMALSIAALRAQGECRITGGDSIRKSYPDFFDHYHQLGGNVHGSIIRMGE